MSALADVAARLGLSGDVILIVKASIALLAGLAAVRVVRRARASVRHVALVATFAALLGLPLVATVAPVVLIGVPVAESAATRTATVAALPAETSRPAAAATRSDTPVTTWLSVSWTSVFRAIWLAGAALLLGGLGVSIQRLSRIARDGMPWLDDGGMLRTLCDDAGVAHVHVVLHEDVPAPLTCGVLRSTIVLPLDVAEWPEEDLRRALVHELEHVRRGDWATQVMGRVACAMYWFHPLAWRALRSLCLEAERACDDAVIARTEGTAYAEQLVSLARRLKSGTAPPVLAMAGRSDLAVRVHAVLDATQRRGRAGLFATSLALGVAATLVLTLAPIRTVRAAARAERSTVSGDVASEPAEQRRRPRGLDVAIYQAAEDGDLREMGALLDAGANVNAVVSGDGSPLIAAAREGHVEAVSFLLDRGANVDMGVSGDGNPLIMAAREGHVRVVELLLDRGASVDQVVDGDENALIQASGSGQLPVVKLLVARGANVNAQVWADGSGRDYKGEWRTPLSEARKGRHQEVIAFLESSGAH